MSEQTSVIENLRQNGKPYTAVISYKDTCCDQPHIVFERIIALSSRDALVVAQRRAKRNGLKRTGEIGILRGNVELTGVHSPKDSAHYTDEETMWTSEETLNRSSFAY